MDQVFHFTDAELDRDIAIAKDVFKRHVTEVIPAAFEPKLALARHDVVEALELTADLTEVRPEVVAANPHIVASLRYTAGPPISEEDFRTVTEWPFTSRPNSPSARRSAPLVCRTVHNLADPLRFPWVKNGGKPDSAAREAAINATATLVAVERFRTERRGSASKEQEKAVRDVLQRDAGLTLVDPPPKRGRGNINMLDDLDRGTYTTECVLFGDKCDVPVRLPDGILLPIECKVSNGHKNGWKRVRREAEGKAGRWRRHFGDSAVMPAVMLAGNYDKGVLRDFQEDGGIIFWQHDLQRLVDLVYSHSP